MKFKLIIDKEKDEQIVATVHSRSALTDEIEALISRHTDRIPGYTEDDIRAGHLAGLRAEVKKRGIKTVCETLEVGEPTLMDIISELEKPGRDIRDSFDAPILREDVMSLSDLKPDMILTGTVRNVTDYGAFVDIGVHQDGLVHISQLSNKFIKHPSEAVSLGDVVKVKVLTIDVSKKRISLTMKFKE